MRDAKLMIQWDHTATLQAQIINANLPPNKPPIKPSKLNPLRRRTNVKRTPAQDDRELDRYITEMEGMKHGRKRD